MNQAVHMKAGVSTTYAQMVTNLFKQMDGVGSRMMHAAIGMAGESGELRTAKGRKNILEECGDLEFYIEAAWQLLPAGLRAGHQGFAKISQPQFGNILDDVHVFASNALDHAKKVWVYGGSKGMRNEEIAGNLMRLELTLQELYENIGVDRIGVQQLNMAKLLGTDESTGRYETGVYSDAQALDRADKAGERKFFGAKSA